MNNKLRFPLNIQTFGEEDTPLTFDEILSDKVYQSEFDKRVTKAIETATTKLRDEIQTLKGADDNDEWEMKYKDLELKFNESLENLSKNEFNSIVDLAIAKSGAIDSIGVKANISDKIKDLKVVEGKVDGLDEIINGLKETHKHYYPTNLPGGGGIETKIPPKTTKREQMLKNMGIKDTQ